MIKCLLCFLCTVLRMQQKATKVIATGFWIQKITSSNIQKRCMHHKEHLLLYWQWFINIKVTIIEAGIIFTKYVSVHLTKNPKQMKQNVYKVCLRELHSSFKRTTTCIFKPIMHVQKGVSKLVVFTGRMVLWCSKSPLTAEPPLWKLY